MLERVCAGEGCWAWLVVGSLGYLGRVKGDCYLCPQASALAFTLWSWQPPGAEEATGGPRHLSLGGAKRRGLRAALGLRPTPSGLRFSSASPQSQGPQQPVLAVRAAGGEAPSVPTPPVLPEGLGHNASSSLEAPVPKRQSSSGSCTCPEEASPAPRAAVPPRVARGPTPRTEEAAWAAMALTFLLVLLTLATLCTRLHRNFRRGESIYWEPTADSQDTVAGEQSPSLPAQVRPGPAAVL